LSILSLCSLSAESPVQMHRFFYTAFVMQDGITSYAEGRDSTAESRIIIDISPDFQGIIWSMKTDSRKRNAGYLTVSPPSPFHLKSIGEATEFLCSQTHSSFSILPSILTLIILIGTFRCACTAAVFARWSSPPQQGTSMTITVSVLIFASSMSARSFSM
jgi:hypothetical protein